MEMKMIIEEATQSNNPYFIVEGDNPNIQMNDMKIHEWGKLQGLGYLHVRSPFLSKTN